MERSARCSPAEDGKDRTQAHLLYKHLSRASTAVKMLATVGALDNFLAQFKQLSDIITDSWST